MDFLFAYIIVGIIMAWAADSFSNIPIAQRLAIIVFWLPATILMGIIARRN